MSVVTLYGPSYPHGRQQYIQNPVLGSPFTSQSAPQNGHGLMSLVIPPPPHCVSLRYVKELPDVIVDHIAHPVVGGDGLCNRTVCLTGISTTTTESRKIAAGKFQFGNVLNLSLAKRTRLDFVSHFYHLQYGQERGLNPYLLGGW